MNRRRRLLVVGNGLATDRLLDELVEHDADVDITVIGEEPGGAYNRILLARVLAGSEPDTIVTKPTSWYAENGVALLSGRWVQRLDTARHLAYVGNGETLGYDVAVLATGSRPRLPPVSGLTTAGGERTPGVHVFRSLEDAVALRADVAARARRALVVGAGLLGLEAAKALADLGHDVTLVHPRDTLLDTQLDDIGGELLRAAVEQLGIRVVIGRITDVLARARVEAVRLDDGRIEGADVVVFTIGVQPRIELATASGLETARAVVVDERLRTSAPDVYAIGECAEYQGVTVGLVAPCWDQAAVVAARLGGDSAATYTAGRLSTRLKVAGIEVSSMGLVTPELPHDDVVQLVEQHRGRYRKLIVRDQRLVGAMLVGDPERAPRIAQLYERGGTVPTNPIDLFCSVEAFAGTVGATPDICVCNRVSEERIVEAIANGCSTVEDLQQTTRAGTGCGTCVSTLAGLLGKRSSTAAGPATGGLDGSDGVAGNVVGRVVVAPRPT